MMMMMMTSTTGASSSSRVPHMPQFGSKAWFEASLKGYPSPPKPSFSQGLGAKSSALINTIVNTPDAIHNTLHTTGQVIQGLRQLPQNPSVQKGLGDVAHNLAAASFQNGETLKPNVALLATLFHVMMRVKEAYDSANAPATSVQEKQYNQEQSAMTYFREVVGFTTGFVLLKRLQGFFGGQLANRLGYQKQQYGRVGIGKSLSQGVGLLSGTLKPEALYRMPEALPNQGTWQRLNKKRPVNATLAQIGYALEQRPNTEWVFDPAFIKRAWNMVAGQEVKAALTAATGNNTALAKNLVRWEGKGFELAYKQLPVYLGAIPSVLIAGFGVEYASLHYGKKVKKYMLGLMSALHVIPPEHTTDEPSGSPQAAGRTPTPPPAKGKKVGQPASRRMNQQG